MTFDYSIVLLHCFFDRKEESATERIQSLLESLKEFGIPEYFLFDVEHLVSLKNIPKVREVVHIDPVISIG